jgi:hypothetical protein
VTVVAGQMPLQPRVVCSCASQIQKNVIIAVVVGWLLCERTFPCIISLTVSEMFAGDSTTLFSRVAIMALVACLHKSVLSGTITVGVL